MIPIPQKEPASSKVHSFCTSQGLKILISDHDQIDFNEAQRYLRILNKGNIWCDEGFKSIHHFFNPKTGKGILGLTGADTMLIDSLEKVKYSIKKRNIEQSYFHIGSALHLIQDLCVPHHALGHLLKGHNEYENWVLENYRDFSVEEGGLYHFRDPLEILKYNGLKAIKYEEIITSPTEEKRREATKELLSLAQRTTAGFLYLVLKEVLSI